jgi:hypothetical protein
MPRGSSIVWVQLATRIPKSLHRELRLHCVTVDTSVMDFVVNHRWTESRASRYKVSA